MNQVCCHFRVAVFATQIAKNRLCFFKDFLSWQVTPYPFFICQVTPKEVNSTRCRHILSAEVLEDCK